MRCAKLMEPPRAAARGGGAGNVLAYVVAYEEGQLERKTSPDFQREPDDCSLCADGSARDVTPRYARAFVNVTLNSRVPTSSKVRKENGGSDWFAGMIAPFGRGFKLVRFPLSPSAAPRMTLTAGRVNRTETWRKRKSFGIGKQTLRCRPRSAASRAIPSASSLSASTSCNAEKAAQLMRPPPATFSSSIFIETKRSVPAPNPSGSSRANSPSSGAPTSSTSDLPRTGTAPVESSSRTRSR